jgi:hypothetical protein
VPAAVTPARLPGAPAGWAGRGARAELLDRGGSPLGAAFEPSAVHALAFWASVVAHVGKDGPDGHFLASYESVASPPASAR